MYKWFMLYVLLSYWLLVLCHILKLVDQTPVINERIQAVSNVNNFGSLLKKLLLTAESNALKFPQQRRALEILKNCSIAKVCPTNV